MEENNHCHRVSTHLQLINIIIIIIIIIQSNKVAEIFKKYGGFPYPRPGSRFFFPGLLIFIILTVTVKERSEVGVSHSYPVIYMLSFY
jgi:hypothetical protein